MASKRAQRRKACEGKVRFDSKEEAHRVRRLMNNGEYAARQKLIVYGCPFGAHWHVGHKPRRQRQAEAAKRRER